MFYDAIRNDHGFAVDPFKALIARPIGWLSTVSAEGVANLAPYSFFNAVSERPHYVVFGSSGYKDSLRNIEATGEFAMNVATYPIREAMNLSSSVVPSHVDEFALAGLTKAPCQLIKAPRVAESPANLECHLYKTMELPDNEGKVSNWLVVGRVIGIHIDDRFIENGRVNSNAMQMISRVGYAEYATIDDIWRMRRPDP
jgi:flavin reductase (DIM6/NTAB) family NADH-FMN oxidoreductase RutF